MSEAWEIFRLTAAWVGLALGVLIAFWLIVWLVSLANQDEPKSTPLPEAPKWTYERTPVNVRSKDE